MGRKYRWGWAILFLALGGLGLLYHLRAPTPQIVLARDTPMETTVSTLAGKQDGPCLFVIAGIHGDEVAGWMAAERLAQELLPQSGTVYILSPANAYGAAGNVRRTYDSRDLNRTFPGSLEGDATQRLSREIFELVAELQPVLVLDLHEAEPKRENRDYLGNSIVFSTLDGMEDLIFSILTETGEGRLCSQPFDYFTAPPAGSFNQAISQELGIPVITIETYREDPLEVRIQNHIDLVTFIAAWYKVA